MCCAEVLKRPEGNEAMSQRTNLITRLGTTEEVGANLLARLAYPLECQVKKRNDAALRLQGRMLSQADLSDRVLKPEEETAFRFWATSRAGMGSIERRLRHRQAAGNIAVAILLRDRGEPVGLPDDLGKPTLENMFIWLAREDRGQGEHKYDSNARNIERRIWNETLPVMNLAAALCKVLQQRHRMGRPVQSILEFGSDPLLLAYWINQANSFGPDVERLWAGRAATGDQLIFVLEAA